MRQSVRIQQGIGLVELMVALTIGLVLIGGVVQIFSANKQGYRVQQAQSRLLENSRLVSIMLASNIAKAGFHQNALDGPDTIFTAGQLAVGSGGANLSDNVPANTFGDSLANTDNITFRFQADGLLTDCLGATPAAGTISVNTYRVRNDNTLMCSNDGNATFQPLIDNVVDMQILYGMDTDTDGSANQYVTATNVVDFNNVFSVHFALLLESNNPILPTPLSQQYTLVDRVVTVPPAANPDRIQRRVIERVVALRSRLP